MTQESVRTLNYSALAKAGNYTWEAGTSWALLLSTALSEEAGSESGAAQGSADLVAVGLAQASIVTIVTIQAIITACISVLIHRRIAHGRVPHDRQ